MMNIKKLSLSKSGFPTQGLKFDELDTIKGKLHQLHF
jgi:hypothetical protein